MRRRHPYAAGTQWHPHLPFPPATSQEIRDVLLGTKSTTPGVEGIPAEALQLA